MNQKVFLTVRNSPGNVGVCCYVVAFQSLEFKTMFARYVFMYDCRGVQERFPGHTWRSLLLSPCFKNLTRFVGQGLFARDQHPEVDQCSLRFGAKRT